MNTLKNLLSLNDDERLLAEVRTYQEKLISNVLQYLVENFGIAPITTPEEDLKQLLQ